MSGRAWRWAGGLAVVGGTLLGWTIHSFDTWHRPANGVQVLTLGQLLGFVVSATLLAIAVAIPIVVVRRRRLAARAASRQRSGVRSG